MASPALPLLLLSRPFLPSIIPLSQLSQVPQVAPIGHAMSHPVTPSSCAAHVPLMFAPAIRWFHGAVFRILHTPYGIRNSGIGIRDLETGQFLLLPVLFRSNPREHWPECGSDNSSWCGIFHLDHEDDGAVGSPHRRMERWCNERNSVSPIEILSEMVRLYDAGIRPQVVRGMWREEKEWEFAIEQARQRVREWNNLIDGVKEVGQ